MGVVCALREKRQSRSDEWFPNAFSWMELPHWKALKRTTYIFICVLQFDFAASKKNRCAFHSVTVSQDFRNLYPVPRTELRISSKTSWLMQPSQRSGSHMSSICQEFESISTGYQKKILDWDTSTVRRVLLVDHSGWTNSMIPAIRANLKITEYYAVTVNHMIHQFLHRERRHFRLAKPIWAGKIISSRHTYVCKDESRTESDRLQGFGS